MHFSCSVWHGLRSRGGIRQVDGLQGPRCLHYVSDAWVGMAGMLGSAETFALGSHM